MTPETAHAEGVEFEPDEDELVDPVAAEAPPVDEDDEAGEDEISDADLDDEVDQELQELDALDDFTEAEIDFYESLDRRDDRIAVVCPGDSGGWAQFVNICLGLGDGLILTAIGYARVLGVQDEHGLDADGVVRGATWAHVLPELRLSERPSGMPTMILRGLLGLGRAGGIDAEVVRRLELIEGVGVDLVDADVWVGLLELTQDDVEALVVDAGDGS